MEKVRRYIVFLLGLFINSMGVVLMDRKPFDFKDLMAFGMFILALLTFVFSNLK